MAGENTTNTPSISTGDQFSQPKTQGNPENAEAKSSMCFSLVAEVLKMQVARLADPHFSRPGPRALARKIPQTFLQIFSIRFATIKKDRSVVAGRTEKRQNWLPRFDWILNRKTNRFPTLQFARFRFHHLYFQVL